MNLPNTPECKECFWRVFFHGFEVGARTQVQLQTLGKDPTEALETLEKLIDTEVKLRDHWQQAMQQATAELTRQIANK